MLRELIDSLVWGLCFFACAGAFTGDAAQEVLPKLKLVTPERIAQMAAPERAEWEAYLQQSQRLAVAERAKLAEELAELLVKG